MNGSTFDEIRNWAYEAAGLVFDDGKEYLVEARLRPLANKRGLESVDELVRELRHGSRELRDAVVDALTINETSFFRDPLVFEAVRTQLLPDLVERRAVTRRLDFWSAACSSGQEAVSLSILLREELPDLDRWDARILCTDISPEMVERTSAGSYSSLEVKRGLRPEQLSRNFRSEGSEFRTVPEIRSLLECRELNLTRPFPDLGRFDVVFLRNVLIYFDEETKGAILRRVSEVLRPDGVLFLGTAETANSGGGCWRRSQVGGASYYAPAA